MSRFIGTRTVLAILAAFVAISALPSAFLVVPAMPLDWLKAGPFTDWTIPAIALFFVGAVEVLALAAVVWRPWAGALASVVAGAAMVVFELVEISVVGWTLSDPGPSYFQSWLQLVYLVVGTLQVLVGLRLWLVSREDAPPLWLIHPAHA